jgi:hypothetical protein
VGLSAERINLELVDTESLIAELMDRHDALVIVREKEPTGDLQETLFDIDGGVSRAIGMVDRLKAKLMRMAAKADTGEE